MGQYWSLIYPPTAVLTEDNLTDQSGKVFIITGGSSGCGLELASILYMHNARVYIAARSKATADEAITTIKQRHPGSSGEIKFLHLDLSDLTTIKKSATEFLSKESRLDVLWNNAGVMWPPQGSVTAQGYELQLGTNNVGHFLFTRLLYPLLVKTAKSSPTATVRVVWVSSAAALRAPNPAVDFANMDYHNDESPQQKYARSKAGNVLHACEMARLAKTDGIISVSLHPGLLMTNLQRYIPSWQVSLFGLVAYPAKYGAYTELYAGLHDDVTQEHNGAWLLPWGRIVPARKDLADAALGRQYWEWSENQIKAYL
ncbi:hypothetical protein NLG97_g3216 [Lecanicillium saksenae]|uniref:Uncharacterized protein n=1 Tax=Lecanicillium saksenae TaxID=468837 RepID=A0ACC1QYP4_9HYPO|nr:hypothetical protein NLG97_g3216 [Lecanicillium saksenae]